MHKIKKICNQTCKCNNEQAKKIKYWCWDGGCGSLAGALFVPFLAGGLGVAFSLPFLVAILKRKKEINF